MEAAGKMEMSLTFLHEGEIGPYQANSSGYYQGPVSSIAKMRQRVAERTGSEDTVVQNRQRVLLIVGPEVPAEVVDLFCEYCCDVDVAERIDYTDPRVGSFTQVEGTAQFTSGQAFGIANGRPVFLLHPDHVREGDDVVTLNYFPEEEGVRTFTAPIEHLVDDDFFDEDFYCPDEVPVCPYPDYSDG
jgi:hypothetical protein